MRNHIETDGSHWANDVWHDKQGYRNKVWGDFVIQHFDAASADNGVLNKSIQSNCG